MVDLQVQDQTIPAHLATPESGRGPGIILCHAWWGLTPFFKELCGRLAGSGFVALAPDLYHGRTAATIEEAQAIRTRLDRKRANLTVRAAVDYLLGSDLLSGDRLGTIGFSLGASFALEAARSRPAAVAAVVLFYGTGGGRFDKTTAAYQGHFAANGLLGVDRWGANAAKVAKFKDRLLAAQRAFDFYTYADTGHWFFESDRPDAYDPAAAVLAWDRTVAFLRDQLA